MEKTCPGDQNWPIKSTLMTHPGGPRITNADLQASLASVKVGDHDLTTRKRLGKNGMYGSISKELYKLNVLEGLSPIRSDIKLKQHFIKRTSY